MAEHTYTLPTRVSNPTVARWARWVSKGVLAIVDQGLISGSNFVISILLARWLAADQYGAYALAFSTFILLTQIYQALILEPMSVFGGSTYRNSRREYMGVLTWIHFAIAFVIVVGLGAASLVLHFAGVGSTLPSALAAAGIAGPCVLLFWLARRGYYLGLMPLPAASGALLYCGIVIAGLVMLYRTHLLSPATAFLLMGAGALATGIVLLLRLRPVWRCSREYLATAWRQHWIYGRWALAAAFATWVPFNIYFIFLTGFGGMSATGHLRALINFALPVGQTATALSLLFQPFTARILDDEGIGGMRRITTRITQLYFLGAALYWGSIILARHQLVHLLYGTRYEAVIYLLPILAISSAFQAANHGPAIGLRSMQLPRLVFWAYLAGAGISLVIGLVVTFWFGLPGALVSMTASYIGIFCVANWLLRRSSATYRAEVAA